MPAKSKAQQRFMGLVKSYQDGDVPASKVSKSVKDAAKSMDKGDVEDYASTKHKGKPEKVTEGKLDRIAKALFKDLNKKFPKYDTERKNSTRDFNRVVKYLKGKMPRVPNKKVGEIALNYFNYRKSAKGHNIIPSIGRNDIKDMTKLLTSLGMKEASTTAGVPAYKTPFAFKKSTFKAIGVDDEDDKDELIGGMRDVRKKNTKKDKEQKKMKELKDHEGKMAKSQLERSMKYSKMIYNMIQNVDKGKGVEFPAWVQSKLTKAEDYLQSVFNYLDGKDGLEDKFQEGVTIKTIVEGVRVRDGESAKPGMWEVFDNHTGKSIKVVKTASSATRLMNRLMNSGQYNEIATKWVGESVDEISMKMAPFSSSEAKQHINQDIKKMSKFLGKASQQSIKLMMNGVKGGKYTAMDISRGLKEGPAGRTHYGELGFLQQLWNKVRDGFRRYSKDKKLS